jgi:hypothetical protein
MLSRYVVSPREGHLEQAFHLFAYLKHHKRSRMVFDDSEPVFGDKAFNLCDWSEFYPDAEETIPHNVQKHVETAWLHQVLWTRTMPSTMEAVIVLKPFELNENSNFIGHHGGSCA